MRVKQTQVFAPKSTAAGANMYNPKEF
jgi:hypothetical protein